jgi:hypothetical protein
MKFHKVEPEVGERETRTITVLEEHDGLAERSYALIESFCPDPACDCRRVMLNIACKEQLERGFLATVSFGFDRDEEMAGPFLDPLNPQSEYSDALLHLVSDVVLNDRRYVQRLDQHYHLVKRAAVDRQHPAYAVIQEEVRDSRNDSAFVTRPPRERVPRNAPCPCGSGREYKLCCLWKDRQETLETQHALVHHP